MSEAFNQAQLDSMQSVFTQLKLTPMSPGGASGGDSAGAAHDVFGYAFDDVCKEEQWKAQRHPWELWQAMRACAQSGELPAPEETFLFKHHGIFNVSPAQQSLHDAAAYSSL